MVLDEDGETTATLHTWHKLDSVPYNHPLVIPNLHASVKREGYDAYLVCHYPFLVCVCKDMCCAFWHCHISKHLTVEGVEVILCILEY